MKEQIPLPEKAAELTTLAIRRAAHHLQKDGGFMAMAVVESTTTPVIPPEFQGDQRPGLGFLPVLAQEPGPLRQKIHELRGDVTAYAIVANATLRSPDGNETIDAIVVETAVLGGRVAHVIVQPYRLGDQAGFVGDAGIIDTTDNVLADGPQPGAALSME